MTSAIAIVPAAGASSRFGSMKLVADIDGIPMLSRTLASLFEAGVARAIVVVAPEHSLGGLECLADSRVTLVTNTDPSRGMFSSIQAGLAVADGDPIVILPADMPFVPAETIRVVLAEAVTLQAPIVPTYNGRRGHPLAIPSRLRRALLAVPATSNLKAALLAAAGEPPIEVPVDSPGVLRDVDVPQDLHF